MTIYILPFSALDFDRLAPLLPFVSAGRRERIARMKNDTAKTASLLSALLVRMAVSERTGVPASELVFSAHEGGKPHCVGVPCEFSLSHTSGMIVCAVSDEPVGIDAELLRPAPMRVARRFTDAEREYISGSDERFFRVSAHLPLRRSHNICMREREQRRRRGCGGGGYLRILHTR